MSKEKLDETDHRKFTGLYSSKIREGPRLAQDHIYRNETKIKRRSAFFKLKKHVDNFLEGSSENRFIVMPGLRGVGKTTLLFQLYDCLIDEKRHRTE